MAGNQEGEGVGVGPGESTDEDATLDDRADGGCGRGIRTPFWTTTVASEMVSVNPGELQTFRVLSRGPDEGSRGSGARWRVGGELWAGVGAGRVATH